MSAITDDGPRRTTGGLLVVGAVAFAAAATGPSSTFDWPDIPRQPASVVLPAFVGGGTSVVWTWFVTAWSDAILAVPISPPPAAPGRRDDSARWAATFMGATSVVLSMIGFVRWVFVVPPLARALVAGNATTKAAADYPLHQGDVLATAALGVILLPRPSGGLVPARSDVVGKSFRLVRTSCDPPGHSSRSRHGLRPLGAWKRNAAAA